MGYHRDGDQLGLDPFETEMRRRIWWQIVVQETKFAMISGLAQSLQSSTSDTKMPQNINDADIFPGLTAPVQARAGPTEMAFCLLISEIFRFKMESDNSAEGHAFEAALLGHDLDGVGDSSGPHQPVYAKFRAKVLSLERRLAELEALYVDASAGNVHRAALAIRPMMTNKLIEMLVPMREQPGYGSEVFDYRDNMCKMLIMGHENRLGAMQRLRDTGYLWWMKLHFQCETLAVVTSQLCRRPVGPLADRSWAVVEGVYEQHEEMGDVAQKQYAVQAQFTLRAWRCRERALAQAGQPCPTPPFILRLRELMPAAPLEGRPSVTPPAPAPAPQPQTQPVGHGAGLAPADGDADPLFGSFLDMPALNWDMFGDLMVGADGDQLSAAMFSGLALGNMNVPMGGVGAAVDGTGGQGPF